MSARRGNLGYVGLLGLCAAGSLVVGLVVWTLAIQPGMMQARYNRIGRGMEMAEVERVMGAPTRKYYRGVSGEAAIWQYVPLARAAYDPPGYLWGDENTEQIWAWGRADASIGVGVAFDGQGQVLAKWGCFSPFEQ